jgi:hypothetical protein
MRSPTSSAVQAQNTNHPNNQFASQTAPHQGNDGHLHSSGRGKTKAEPGTVERAERLSPSPRSSPGCVSLGLMNGLYSISCSSIEEQCGSSQMGIILCPDTPRVWGAYHFGRYFGIFLLEQRPYRASDEPLPANWRGREYGIGTMA